MHLLKKPKQNDLSHQRGSTRQNLVNAILAVLTIAAFFLPHPSPATPDTIFDLSNDPRVIARQQRPKVDYSQQTEANEIKLMTYNVQNLFDAEHDEGKRDYTFLPLNFPGKKEYCDKLRMKVYRELCQQLDWSDDQVKTKMAQIKIVLEAQGDLPDLLALQEVENENVVRRLAKVLGYSQFVMTNSPDRRGIDVALLYKTEKLELVESGQILMSETRIPFATRDILRAHFHVRSAEHNGRLLAVYVNHWPAQMSSDWHRYFAARALMDEIEKQTKRFKDQYEYNAIVTGDFNTASTDNPNSFHHVLLNPYRKDTKLVDTKDLFLKSKSPLANQMPPGTYYYPVRQTWTYFDRIFISQNLADKKGIRVLPKSFRVFSPEFLIQPVEVREKENFFFASLVLGAPFRYDFLTNKDSKRGYSDHFPVIVKFRY